MNKLSDIASIVLIGSFNPGIFQPSWFEAKGLIQGIETEGAKIEMISNDIAIFTLAWLRIEVVGERFTARTSDESKFGPLRDLVAAVFQLLEHTPIRNIGLNREITFELDSEDAWHRVGHTLAPKNIWNKYVKTPGLMHLMIKAEREDDRDGAVNVQVRPSLLARKSVICDVNDHIDIGDGTGLDASEIIQNEWDKSQERALKIISGVVFDACHQGETK